MSSNKNTLKTYFEPGDRPTSLQFADLIDSSLNFVDDKASDADAENSFIDNKFITPQTARKAVEKFAPVKKVKSKSPDISGNVSLAISDIPNLSSSLSGKQDTLSSGINIISVNGNSILVPTNLLLATPSDLALLQANFPFSIKLATTYSSSTTNRADVAMKFDVKSGKKYKIDLLAAYETVATTTGGSLGFVLVNGGAGSLKGVVEMQTGTASSEKALFSAINNNNTTVGSFITSSQVSAANTPQFILGSLHFQCTADGVFQLQWGSEVSGSSASFGKESVMIVTSIPN